MHLYHPHTGSIEFDEFHSCKVKATEAPCRQPKGAMLEMFGLRQSNQGLAEEERTEARHRRMMFCAMIPAEGDEDVEVSRADRIIRYFI